MYKKIIMAKKKINYKEAVNEIEKIIERIEHQEIDIEQMEKDVQRFVELIKFCKSKLYKTEKELNKLIDE